MFQYTSWIKNSMVKCWDWNVNFLMLSDKIAYATVSFSVAMQRIVLVRQPSPHEKRPKYSLPSLSLPWRLAFSSLKSLKSMPNSGTRRSFGRKLAGQETFKESGNTLVCGTWWGCAHPWVLRDLADVIPRTLLTINNLLWQWGEFLMTGRKQMSLLPSGRARQGTQWNTDQSASHQPLQRCWSISPTKHFQTSEGQECGWK